MWWLLAAAILAALPTPPPTPPAFQLLSSAFWDGASIPSVDAAADDHCGGRNISPPLRWAGAPAETRSFALTVIDEDVAPRGFAHWLLYGMPPSVISLATGSGSTAAYRRGRNDAGALGYSGPCPPVDARAHRYVFRLYALDVGPAALAAALDAPALQRALRGHVLASATLTGRFARTHRDVDRMTR